MNLRRKQLTALGSIATYTGGSDSYAVEEAHDAAVLVTHQPTGTSATHSRHHVNANGIITTLPGAWEKPREEDDG